MSTNFELTYTGNNSIYIPNSTIFGQDNPTPTNQLNDSSGSLGTLLSWHSMHSRYIISADTSIKATIATEQQSLIAFPEQQLGKSTLFRLTAPDSDSTKQIMIWKKETDASNIYKTSGCPDQITWSNGNVNSKSTIYESSYVGIDHFLTNESSKSFTSLSGQVNNNKRDISDLSNRIKMIEQFLGGANPPDKNSPNKFRACTPFRRWTRRGSGPARCAKTDAASALG